MLSSYELLELCEFMPEDGAFKTAARGGEWSHEQAVWVHIANEMAKLRATIHVVFGGKEAAYAPKIFLSPQEMRELVEKDEAQSELRENVYSFADFTDKALPGGDD